MPVAIFIVLLVASLFLILWIAQERIVFQPPARFSTQASDHVRRIHYAASDGQPLIGFLVEPPGKRSGLVLCFHGNADLAVWQVPWAEEVSRRTGHAVFLAEYRGYFGLGGKPTYLATKLDSDAAYRTALAETCAAPETLSLFGHSLGSAVAVELAARVFARRLVLQAPFTSARAMGRLVIGRPLLLLWSRLSRVHFDTESVVRSLEVPVSVVHGERDRIVPSRMGRAVFEAALSKGSFLLLPEVGHNDIADRSGEEYWTWLAGTIS